MKKKAKIEPESTKVLVVSEERRQAIEKLKEPEKFRNVIFEYGRPSMSPENGYKEGAELLSRALSYEKLTDAENKKLSDIALGTNITKNHRMLAEVVTEDRDRMAMMEMTDDLIKEYDCKTVSEQSLCEIVVNSFTQVLKINRKMTSTIDAGQYLSNERNAYISVLSKELERANRNYLYALNTLKEFKSPNLNIHIKTKTAIIGTNQQFNNNLPSDENIAG